MATLFQDRFLKSRQMVQKTMRQYYEKPALRAYLEIFLTLTAISLFAVYAIRPTVKTIGNLLKEIKAKEETLKTMDEKIGNLETAKALYIKEADKIRLVGDAIPQRSEPDILAFQITQLSDENGVVIDGMGIEGAKLIGVEDENDDRVVNFSLSVTGDYLTLIEYAQKLENVRRPVKYDSVSLSSLKSKDENILFLDFGGLSAPYLPKK